MTENVSGTFVLIPSFTTSLMAEYRSSVPCFWAMIFFLAEFFAIHREIVVVLVSLGESLTEDGSIDGLTCIIVSKAARYAKKLSRNSMESLLGMKLCCCRPVMPI